MEHNTFLPDYKGKSVEVSDAELEQNTLVPDYKGKSVSSLPNLHPDLDDEKIKDNFISLLGVGSCIDSFALAYKMYVAYDRFRGFGVRKCNQKYAGGSDVVNGRNLFALVMAHPIRNILEAGLLIIRRHFYSPGVKLKFE